MSSLMHAFILACGVVWWLCSSEAIMAGAICGITSGVVAYIFGCHRTKKKTEKEKSELLRYIKLQNNLYDVAEQRWKEEYDELYASYLSMKKDTEDRDYGTSACMFVPLMSIYAVIASTLLYHIRPHIQFR
jgi:hypothetical protein